MNFFLKNIISIIINIILFGFLSVICFKLSVTEHLGVSIILGLFFGILQAIEANTRDKKVTVTLNNDNLKLHSLKPEIGKISNTSELDALREQLIVNKPAPPMPPKVRDKSGVRVPY